MENNKNSLVPLTQSARKASLGITWATLLLFLVCTTSVVGLLLLAGYRVVPLWLCTVLNTIVIYASYTVLHEAVHGNISGNVTGPTRLDEIAGSITGILMMVPFSAHKTLHLTHHRFTNDPQRDPDHYTKGTHAVSILLRCSTVPIAYLVYCTRHWQQPDMRRALWTSIWAFVQTGILLVLLGVIFGWQVPIFGYLVPVLIALPTLGFLFDWIVHTPHTDQRRFHNTTVFEGTQDALDIAYTVATLQQNYHGIHHAFPRIPFTRYRTFFKKNRQQLIDLGLPVKQY